jgi:hypothetical protein
MNILIERDKREWGLCEYLLECFERMNFGNKTYIFAFKKKIH